ncbi:hypothetical protein HK096_007856 [Nowakowskiella sp. JEL0078]|nr:hypothetical protein HK096_007856 [Nowakowskiella sp. JEL0078]
MENNIGDHVNSHSISVEKSVENFSENNILTIEFQPSFSLDSKVSQFNIKRRVSDQSSISTLKVGTSPASDVVINGIIFEDDGRTSYSSSADTLNGLIPSRPNESPTPSGQRHLFRSRSDSHSFNCNHHLKPARSPETADEPVMPRSPRMLFSAFSPRPRTPGREIPDSRRSSIVEHDVDLDTYQQHISSEKSSYALAMSFITQATPTSSIYSVPSIVVEEEVSDFEIDVDHDIGFSSKNMRSRGRRRTLTTVQSSLIMEDTKLSKSSLRRFMSLNASDVIERKFIHILEEEASGMDSMEVHNPRELFY